MRGGSPSPARSPIDGRTLAELHAANGSDVQRAIGDGVPAGGYVRPALVQIDASAPINYSSALPRAQGVRFDIDPR